MQIRRIQTKDGTVSITVSPFTELDLRASRSRATNLHELHRPKRRSEKHRRIEINDL